MQTKKRNSNAGVHPSYTSRGMTEEQIKAKRAYDKKFHSTPARIAYRSKLNKANRKAGTYGKMTAMGKDRSHTKSGKLVLESTHANRARNRGKKNG